MKASYVYNLCITSQVYRNKTGKHIEKFVEMSDFKEKINSFPL